ncbi:MAG: hypothetical protein AAGJ86_06425 [Pseudomonadota bacterium]
MTRDTRDWPRRDVSMKLAAFTASILVTACSKPTVATPELPYSALKPPGKVAVPFAPGLVTTEHLEVEGAFGHDMKTFYFLRQILGEPSRNYVIRYSDGAWSEPEEITTGDGEVFISPDSRTMHIGSQYRERTISGWSEPKSLGAPYDAIPIMRLTASKSGTYVFDERDEIGTLRYSTVIDGKRQPPQPFPAAVNSGEWTAHPFIAPDERFLIWDSERDDGFGGGDLYISFRQDDGSWGPAINMGDGVNDEHDNTFGSVTPDGKYFLFQTIDLDSETPSANILWIDASFIDGLKQASR